MYEIMTTSRGLVFRSSEPTPASRRLDKPWFDFAPVASVRRNDYELGAYEDLLMDSERPDADYPGEIWQFCLG
jgi:hypothetical protein